MRQPWFRLQPDEIYMGKWLMDKQIIDLKGSKVVRVNDIKLFWLQSRDQKYLVLKAVDIGLRGLARRLGVEFLFRRLENHLVWWEFIQHPEEKTASLQTPGGKTAPGSTAPGRPGGDHRGPGLQETSRLYRRPGRGGGGRGLRRNGVGYPD